MKLSNFDKPKDDSLEKREDNFLSTVNFLKRIDLQNIVESPEKKDKFIKNITFNEFQNFLLRINGLLRDVPTSKREFNAGEQAKSIVDIKNEEGEVLYCPPLKDDKMQLLNDSLDSLKRMIIKGNRYDGAIMLGATINAIHPFEDGNGRTARMVTTLLASSKGELRALDVNPEVLQPFIEIYIKDVVYKLKSLPPTEISASSIIIPGLDYKTNIELQYAFENDFLNIFDACNIFCKKEGDNFEEICFSSSGVFSVDKFFDKYSTKILDFINTYRELKNKYIKVLIDVFENPKRYLIKNIPLIFNNMSPLKQKVLADKTFMDLIKTKIRSTAVYKDEFSYDFLIKFIKGDVV